MDTCTWTHAHTHTPTLTYTCAHHTIHHRPCTTPRTVRIDPIRTMTGNRARGRTADRRDRIFKLMPSFWVLNRDQYSRTMYMGVCTHTRCTNTHTCAPKGSKVTDCAGLHSHFHTYSARRVLVKGGGFA